MEDYCGPLFALNHRTDLGPSLTDIKLGKLSPFLEIALMTNLHSLWELSDVRPYECRQRLTI
jgi:hypothetical protein